MVQAVKTYIAAHTNDWRVLYKHASSWAISAATLYEAARLQGIDLAWMPRWTVVALGLLGLAAKLWKQP